MEDIKGYIELVIAATYSAHTIIAFRDAGNHTERSNGSADSSTPNAASRLEPEPAAHHRLRFSPEAICLLAVALSYYMMGGLTVFAGH